MSGDPQAPVLRRILVALDASRESLAALQTAAALAASLEAELTGLFVEDIDLLNLAGLPFAREVSLLTRAARTLDPETVEAELRAQAGLARRALAEVAESLRLPWSFRTVRGRVTAELLAAAVEVDLVAVGRGRARLGRTARAVVAQASRSVLVAAPAAGAAPARIALAVDGSPCAAAALVAAARLARREGAELAVFVMAADADEAERRETAAAEQLRTLGVAATYRRLVGVGAGELRRVVEREGARLLVLGADASAIPDSAVALLLEIAGCPLLLVRTNP